MWIIGTNTKDLWRNLRKVQNNDNLDNKSINLPSKMVFNGEHIQGTKNILNSFNDHFINIASIVNPFPNNPWFLRVCSTSLLKTLREKEKLLGTRNFSFSHSVFWPVGELSAILIKFEIVVCKLSEFGRV